MTNKLSLAFGGLLAAALILVSMLFLVSGERDAHASIYNGTVIGTATTTTAVAVTNSVTVLATTTSTTGPSYTRVYATICNGNANPVFLNMNNGNKASLTNAVYIIAAAAGYNACFEVTDRNMYQGSIAASSTNETSTTVNVTQYVQ